MLFFTTLFLFDTSLFAQKPPQNRGKEIIPDETEQFLTRHNMRVNVESGIPVSAYELSYKVNPDSPQKMAEQFLRENHSMLHLRSDLSDLKYTNTIETPGGYHVHFTQYMDDYPVYKSTLNVTISRNSKVVFVMNGYKTSYGSKNQINIQSPRISKNDALLTAKNYLGVNQNINFEKTETVVYYKKGQFTLVQKVNIVPSQGLTGDWEVLVDAHTGEIIKAVDNACYFDGGGHNGANTVDGSGWVFDPDPITRATTTYGSPGFIDNNDADSDSLTAQLEDKVLHDISYDGSVYSLVGPYAEITDFEAPYTGLHTNTSSDFHFTRSSDNFEAVNTYFHIDESMRYINETLGFTVIPFQYTGGVRFDPHGLNGDDNSHYIPSTGSIAYGDGGVDDAEDFSVIKHELGHGIHDWLTSGNLSQVEGLSEGSGDYWAASYLRSTGYWEPADPAYNWVFVWDGHNPFWPGRITNYTAHYPEGLTGDIHTDGQMWASSLMSIYDFIGREATDSDFLEALSMTNSGSGQQDAAYAFISADQLLYGGANVEYIAPVFMDRGYIESPVTADFTADVTGGEVPLTVQFTDLSVAVSGDIVSWEWDFNNDGTIDSYDQNPVWTYTENGSYTVKLTASDGTDTDTEIKQDYISVNSGIFVWEGIANGPNYSGAYIRDYLQSEGFDVVYSSAPSLPSSLQGYDAAFLSYGNYGSNNTVLEDVDASVIIDYLQSGGKVYLEGGDALGYDQSSNTTLLNLFGLASASDGSSGNHPVTDLQGQTGALTEDMHFTGSTQPNTSWIDLYTPNSNGVLAFVQTGVGNVGVQGTGTYNQKTFCFSYALGYLTDGTSPTTKADLINQILEYFDVQIPVEFTSLTADVVKDAIQLKWTTATETNNRGFEVQRSQKSDWKSVGFVAGFGTTTEPKSYSFIDKNVNEGTYSYRLKQIDFDGAYEYSSIVEVEISTPAKFALEQNYPNPFNPTTKIKYSVAEDGLVKLTVYNTLGQRVADLVNKEVKAGNYEVDFNASNLSSGVYYYKIETNGFVNTKKMILLR
jgi:PKD repeat protein/predicted small secreted protein